MTAHGQFKHFQQHFQWTPIDTREFTLKLAEVPNSIYSGQVNWKQTDQTFFSIEANTKVHTLLVHDGEYERVSTCGLRPSTLP